MPGSFTRLVRLIAHHVVALLQKLHKRWSYKSTLQLTLFLWSGFPIKLPCFWINPEEFLRIECTFRVTEVSFRIHAILESLRVVSLSSISTTHVEEVARQSIDDAFLSLALNQPLVYVEGSRRTRQLLIDRENFVQVHLVLGGLVFDSNDF